jgi:hypothetical protein
MVEVSLGLMLGARLGNPLDRDAVVGKMWKQKEKLNSSVNELLFQKSMGFCAY